MRPDNYETQDRGEKGLTGPLTSSLTVTPSSTCLNKEGRREGTGGVGTGNIGPLVLSSEHE